MKSKKKFYVLGVLLIVLIAALCMSGCQNKDDNKTPENKKETSAAEGPSPTPNIDYTDKHLKVTAKDTGYDIYAPIKGSNWGYHYGPAILMNDDGSIDAWFASPGKLNELDWFAYKHSDDGGKTWSDETIALFPTAGSLDYLSVCDPDVIHFGGYYYIGYTSTIDGTGGGICNSAFVARSKNPDGPYEKWNGSGWGGDPWPMVYFQGKGTDWGCGEPSMVVVDDTIYIYHSMTCTNLNNQASSRCYVYTADATSENWPATMKYQGMVLDYSAGTRDGYTYSSHDSLDVAYIEQYRKFIAVGTNRRFGNDSCIVYYESNDGINFTRGSEINKNILAGCHNCGISKDGNGHIKEGDKVLIGYGYAGADNNTWGFWATRFNELEITITDEIDRSEESEQNVREKMTLYDMPEEPYLIALSSSTHVYKKNVGKTFTMKLATFDNAYTQGKIEDPSQVTFSGYDESIISFDGFEITGLKEGKTTVTAEYKGLKQQFLIVILPEGVKVSSGQQKLASFEPTVKEYTVSISSKEAKQIRSLATFGNSDICELYNNSGNTTYPTSKFQVKCTTSDKTILSIGSDCIIRPKKVGDATVTVSCGDFSYDVTVHVVE